jgi:hypothetical protein
MYKAGSRIQHPASKFSASTCVQTTLGLFQPSIVVSCRTQHVPLPAATVSAQQRLVFCRQHTVCWKPLSRFEPSVACYSTLCSAVFVWSLIQAGCRSQQRPCSACRYCLYEASSIQVPCLHPAHERLNGVRAAGPSCTCRARQAAAAAVGTLENHTY